MQGVMNTMIGGCDVIYSRRCDDDPDEESTETGMDDQVIGRGEREGTYVSSKTNAGGEDIVEQGGGPRDRISRGGAI